MAVKSKRVLLVLLIFSSIVAMSSSDNINSSSNEHTPLTITEINPNIPKIIWSFWDTEELPDFIKNCVQTWIDLNPDYEINIVKTNNIAKYVGEEEAKKILDWKFNDSAQRLSDLVRLEVLQQHGGIWLDASSVLYEPIAWVHQEGPCVVFSILERTAEPLLDSWFIAASKAHPFIIDWNVEFRNVDKSKTIQDYISSVDQTLLDGITGADYLLIYLIGRISYRKYKDNVKVLSTSAIPMNYLVLGGIQSLCRKKTAFVKFRKEERQAIQENPKLLKCIFPNTFVDVKRFKQSPQTNFNSEAIPKSIWTFWDRDEVPDLVLKCIYTWRVHNPEYTVTLLTPNTIANHMGYNEAEHILNNKYADTPQKLSNLVALEILQLEGGIWIDATVVLYESLKWVENEEGSVVTFGNFNQSKELYPTSWFIAASKGNPFIIEWNDELRNIEYYGSSHNYLNSIDRTYIEGFESPSNQLFYIIGKAIHSKYKGIVSLINAYEGPFSYLSNGGLGYLCSHETYMVKLRKEERIALYDSAELERCVFK